MVDMFFHFLLAEKPALRKQSELGCSSWLRSSPLFSMSSVVGRDLSRPTTGGKHQEVLFSPSLSASVEIISIEASCNSAEVIAAFTSSIRLLFSCDVGIENRAEASAISSSLVLLLFSKKLLMALWSRVFSSAIFSSEMSEALLYFFRWGEFVPIKPFRTLCANWSKASESSEFPSLGAE